ncbi:MAG: DUF547 domain-containing protein [Candidatus Obscuribacterales bacterium]|nr:DUF547 domain-containing protein [Candidatus Obscuribacterales bacterium]
MKKVKRVFQIGALPILLLASGLIFIACNHLPDIVEYFQLYTLKVEAPKTCQFTIYNRLLAKYVKNGLVDYTKLKQDGDLKKAINELATTSPEKLSEKQAKLAYWLNAYNLLVLKNIADHYPIKTLSQLENSPLRKRFIVGGRFYTINELENEKLLPTITDTDWRGIFLACNGAKSSPPLANHAFQPETIDTDLKQSCHHFLNDPNNYVYRPERRTCSISPFFRRHQKLIEREYKSVVNLIYQERELDPNFNLTGMDINYAMPFDYQTNDLAAVATEGTTK